jgi:hypothetical protein
MSAFHYENRREYLLFVVGIHPPGMTGASTEAAVAFVSSVVGVVTDAQTYRNLLYLMFAFPLGMVYYVALVVGFSLGLALAVLVVGLGVLLATVIGVRLIASFERGLANRLLGTEIQAPDDVERTGEGVVGTVEAYLRAPSTWRGLGFVVLKCPSGVFAFVFLVALPGAAVELLLLPLFPEGVFNVQVAGWEVARTLGTGTERVLGVLCGCVLAVVGLHVTNAFAGVNATVASSLLGPDGRDTVDRRATNHPE